MTPNVCANSAVIWDNWSGNDERPAASTAGRSSHSDSLARKEGVAAMVATPKPTRITTAQIGGTR